MTFLGAVDEFNLGELVGISKKIYRVCMANWYKKLILYFTKRRNMKLQTLGFSLTHHKKSGK